MTVRFNNRITSNGFTFRVIANGEYVYTGTNAKEALAAVEVLQAQGYTYDDGGAGYFDQVKQLAK